MQNPERIPYVCCPLCDAPDIAQILIADCSKHALYQPALSPRISWLRCSRCEHVFTSGYFTEEALSIVFSRTHQVQQVGGATELEKQRYVSARMVEKILPYAGDGHWLDVGFGNGSLLLTAEEYGFTPEGIDLRKDNVAALQAMRIEARCIDVSGLEQPGRFRVVSMADVLEHIPFPVPALKAVHTLLDDDGILFLSMPNMDCRLWQLMTEQRSNPYWGEIEHYHNFGRRRLFRLLGDNGFEPVRYGISERYRICMEVIAKKRGRGYPGKLSV